MDAKQYKYFERVRQLHDKVDIQFGMYIKTRVYIDMNLIYCLSLPSTYIIFSLIEKVYKELKIFVF